MLVITILVLNQTKQFFFKIVFLKDFFKTSCLTYTVQEEVTMIAETIQIAGVHQKDKKQTIVIHRTTEVTLIILLVDILTMTAASTNQVSTIMEEIHQQVTVQVHQSMIQAVVLHQMEGILGYKVIMKVIENLEIKIHLHIQDIVQVMKIRRKID